MTTYRSDDCFSGLHDCCCRCECKCHGYNFTLEELRILWSLLEREWIPYDKEGAKAVVAEIGRIVEEAKKEKK
jgi:hypothetical protein